MADSILCYSCVRPSSSLNRPDSFLVKSHVLCVLFEAFQCISPLFLAGRLDVGLDKH
jgi:hypothetical protein